MTGPRPACRLCGAEGARPVAAQTLLDLQEDGRSADLPETQVSYLACAHCGTVSLDPPPDPAALEAYYAAATLETGGPLQRAVQQTLNASRLELLQRVTALTGGTCLDVGSAGCAFAEQAVRRLGLTVWCLEPCPPAEAPAGVALVAGSLERPGAADLPAEFDLVTCLSVLEHVAGPDLFLDRLQARIRPGGWLLLEVPSGELLARGVRTVYGQNIYPLHLHHFTAAGLCAALAGRGLAPVHLEDRLVEGYPLLTLIARREDTAEPSARFLRQLDHQQEQARRAFTNLAQSALKAKAYGGRILVWGAGVDTQEMIRTAAGAWPDNCDLCDRNEAKQGRRLAGVPILNPQDVADRDYVLVLAGTRHAALARIILADAARLLPGAEGRFLFTDGESRQS